MLDLKGHINVTSRVMVLLPQVNVMYLIMPWSGTLFSLLVQC